MDHTVSHCCMESLKMIVSLQIDSLGSRLNILTGEGSGLDVQMIYSSFNISNASSLIQSSGLHLRNRLFEASRGQPHTSCDGDRVRLFREFLFLAQTDKGVPQRAADMDIYMKYIPPSRDTAWDGVTVGRGELSLLMAKQERLLTISLSQGFQIFSVSFREVQELVSMK